MPRAKRRPDGRYGAKVSIGKNQCKYVCANSQKELEEKILQLKLKLGKGLDIAAERDTFGEWGELWLKQKKMTVCDQTYRTCVSRYKRFKDLYHFPISKIRLNDFQRIFYDLSNGKGALSKKTLTVA